MFGWRARIGVVVPCAQVATQERNQVLPEGVALIFTTLDIRSLVPDEFERIFDNYLPSAQICADMGAQFTLLSGTPVLEHQYSKALGLAQRLQETTGVPTIVSTTAQTEALKAVGAKKVVIVSPFVREIDERRAKILEAEGMEVVGINCLGLTHNREFTSLPPYASYRAAMEAVREAPECDTINIVCPVWHTMKNIELIEKDSGKIVVSQWGGELFASMRALNLKGPIKGYGKLLEML